jgi:hypothetical protein
LALSEQNYQAAIDILQQRFGNQQLVISTHMDELLKIPACAGDKASQLRFVYDRISVNVRGLEALGVKASQYGSLLIPVLMSKLPQDIRFQIARKTSKEVWDISEILDVIRNEVEAREMSEGEKSGHSIFGLKLSCSYILFRNSTWNGYVRNGFSLLKFFESSDFYAIFRQ